MNKPKIRIVYPRGRARVAYKLPRSGALSLAMLPGAALYGAVSRFVRSVRLERRRVAGSESVISIGNIEVGGNGKTPMSIELINHLASRGHRPVYVSRGFGSEAERLEAVTVVAPGAFGSPLEIPSGVRVLGVDPGRPVTPRIGDEGAVVEMRCPGVPLVFCRDRRRAVEAARRMFEPTHIILDDAFQTWAVGRDVDVVLLDAKRPLGNGRLIPAGTLREGPGSLRRASLIGFNNIARAEGEHRDEPLSELRRWARHHAGWPVPVFGIRRSLLVIDTATRTAAGIVEGPAAAMSSIARPDRFEQALGYHGIDLCLSMRFPDHHRYEVSDIRRIESLLAGKGINRLVVTEKDWVKLREVGPPAANVLVARLVLDVVGDNPFDACERPQAMPAVFR